MWVRFGFYAEVESNAGSLLVFAESGNGRVVFRLLLQCRIQVHSSVVGLTDLVCFNVGVPGRV